MSYYNQNQAPVGVPPPQGYPPEGYPKDAYPPPQGYPPQGYPPQGYPPQYAAPPPPPQQQKSSSGVMEGWNSTAAKEKVAFAMCTPGITSRCQDPHYRDVTQFFYWARIPYFERTVQPR